MLTWTMECDRQQGLYQIIVAYSWHMASQNMVNVDSGNGLLPEGTTLLRETMLTYFQWDSPDGSFTQHAQYTYMWFEFEKWIM